MKNCLIYGNCQIEPLREILQNKRIFTNRYKFIELPPVHLLDASHIKDLKLKIAKTDLFIYQLVSDDYQGIKELGTNYLCSQLPSNSRKIAIPGAYFTGYHPAIMNMKDGEGNKINEPCDYHDVNLLYLFDRGKTVSETINLIQQEDFYQPTYILNNLQITLDELRNREQELDICISDFIEENYHKQKLFYTMNHPGETILNYLADRILKLLNLPIEPQIKHLTEALDFTEFPIYPSVAKALKLKFDLKPQYQIKGETLNLKQAIELFWDFYAENRQLVKLNILQHQQQYAVTVCGIQIESSQFFEPKISNTPNNTNDLLDCIREKTFEDLLDLAEQHYNNKLYQKAIALCEAALKIAPQSIVGWRQLAQYYEAQGELQAAITASERATSIDPKQPDTIIHQARLLELQGDNPAARQLYQQAIALDEAQPPWVYRHLGNIFSEETNYTSAIMAYEKAIAINPDFGAQIYLSLGDAYEKEERWKESVNTYHKALKINPDLEEQIEEK